MTSKKNLTAEEIETKASPPWIKHLEKNQIFVFGSNEAGIHGAGAAKMAVNKWGARDGQGFGPSGSTFAIPTKDWNINILPKLAITLYINRFIRYAETKSLTQFLVTEIGCGLAGYKPIDIAPMFESCMDMENIKLPMNFIEILIEED